MAKIEKFEGFEHDIIPERKGPYFMGDEIGFKVRLKNLENKRLKRSFLYIFQFPGGQVNRPMENVVLNPGDEKTLSLGNPLYLGFLGAFKFSLAIGETHNSFIESRDIKLPIQYLTLVSEIVRDREGYRLQRTLNRLTWVLTALTIIIAIATIVHLIIVPDL